MVCWMKARYSHNKNELKCKATAQTLVPVFCSCEKMADYMYGRERSMFYISATEQFQEKSHKFFDVRLFLST